MDIKELREKLRGKVIEEVFNSMSSDCGIIIVLEDGTQLDCGFDQGFGSIFYEDSEIK